MNELGEWTGGATPKKTTSRYWRDGTIPWVSPKDVKTDHIERTIDYITEEALEATSARIIPSESLLFVTRSGILRHTLPVAANTVPVTINQDIKALTLHEGLVPEFFRFQVNGRSNEMLNSLVKTGVTVESIDFAALRQFLMYVPSAEEQHDIANALTDLTSLLNEAQSSLERSQTLVSTILNAALQEAFSGRFARANGASEWPEVRLKDLLTRIVAGKSMRCRERPPLASEKGVIKVSAVTWGEFNSDESKTLPDNYEPNPDSLIRTGDLLFSRANTRELVGACVIVTDAPHNLYLSDKTLRLELNDPSLARWIHWYLRSPQGRDQLEGMAHGGQASMLNIPQRSLVNCIIPLPDPEVRERTLAAVETTRDLSIAAASDIATVETRVMTLRQKILDLAFTGNLSKAAKSYPTAENLVIKIQSIARTKASKVRTKTTTARISNNDLAESVSSAIQRSGAAGMTFAELRATVPTADYDVLQEALFELLGTKKPSIVQVFDKEIGQLRIVGAKQ